MNKVVAHLLGVYLFHTGTWIYSQLTNIKNFKNIVFSETLRNLDLFPFDSVYSSDQYLFPKKMLNRILRKITNNHYRFFYPICKKENVGLLHAHFGFQAARSLKLKKKTKLPMITTFYGNDISQYPRNPYWRRLYIRLFDEGELFTVEGNFMKKSLIELGCDDQKIIVQHLGINIDEYPYKKRNVKNYDRIKILICASFREKKGIIYAIKAISKLSKLKKYIILNIIGDGELRTEIEILINKLNLSDCIKLLGIKNHKNTINEMYNSNIYLAPSVTAADGDTEGGAPVSLIEALATGLPAISTYHADIPEVLMDGKSGFLVPERDVDALAERLEYLINNTKLWGKMGCNGRKHVEQNYNLTTQVKKLEDIYNMFF